MRVAPAGAVPSLSANASGIRRASQPVSVVQVQPAPAVPQDTGPSRTRTSVGLLFGPTPGPLAVSVRGVPVGSTSRGASSVASGSALGPESSAGSHTAALSPTAPPLSTAHSGQPGFPPLAPSTALAELHDEMPQADLITVQPFPRGTVAIANRFSANVSLGRTLVASDLTSTGAMPAKHLWHRDAPQAASCAPGSPAGGGTRAGAESGPLAARPGALAGSAQRSVLLVDTAPRGSHRLHSSSGVGSNRVLLPPLAPTPSGSNASPGVGLGGSATMATPSPPPVTRSRLSHSSNSGTGSARGSASECAAAQEPEELASDTAPGGCQWSRCSESAECAPTAVAGLVQVQAAAPTVLPVVPMATSRSALVAQPEPGVSLRNAVLEPALPVAAEAMEQEEHDQRIRVAWPDSNRNDPQADAQLAGQLTAVPR